jgi:hypothetical protein
MFRRKPQPEPAPEQEPESAVIGDVDSVDEDTLVEMRTTIFEMLETRVGADVAADMRADFEKHLNSHPDRGAEAGWLCLVGKLITAVDRVTAMLYASRAGIDPDEFLKAMDSSQKPSQASPAAVSDFQFFPKM